MTWDYAHICSGLTRLVREEYSCHDSGASREHARITRRAQDGSVHMQVVSRPVKIKILQLTQPNKDCTVIAMLEYKKKWVWIISCRPLQTIYVLCATCMLEILFSSISLNVPFTVNGPIREFLEGWGLHRVVGIMEWFTVHHVVDLKRSVGFNILPWLALYKKKVLFRANQGWIHNRPFQVYHMVNRKPLYNMWVFFFFLLYIVHA